MPRRKRWPVNLESETAAGICTQPNNQNKDSLSDLRHPADRERGAPRALCKNFGQFVFVTLAVTTKDQLVCKARLECVKRQPFPATSGPKQSQGGTINKRKRDATFGYEKGQTHREIITSELRFATKLGGLSKTMLERSAKTDQDKFIREDCKGARFDCLRLVVFSQNPRRRVLEAQLPQQQARATPSQMPRFCWEKSERRYF